MHACMYVRRAVSADGDYDVPFISAGGSYSQRCMMTSNSCEREQRRKRARAWGGEKRTRGTVALWGRSGQGGDQSKPGQHSRKKECSRRYHILRLAVDSESSWLQDGLLFWDAGWPLVLGRLGKRMGGRL